MVFPMIMHIKDQIDYLFSFLLRINYAKLVEKRDYLFRISITVIALIIITIKLDF